MNKVNSNYRLMFVVNEFAYFISHRKEIALAACEAGYDVTVICPEPIERALLPPTIKIVTTSLKRRSRNPFSELRSLVQFYRIFKVHKPDVVHLITIKPYLYGGIAAWLSGVPAVLSAVAGLGTLISDKSFTGWLRRIILTPIFRLAFSHRNQIALFQNNSDPIVLQSMRAISRNVRQKSLRQKKDSFFFWLETLHHHKLPYSLISTDNHLQDNGQ